MEETAMTRFLPILCARSTGRHLRHSIIPGHVLGLKVQYDSIMLTIPASRATICCHANQDNKILPYAAQCNVPCINFLSKTAFISYPRLPCNQRLHTSGISIDGTPKKWPICASSDDNEYRSYRNIAISLFRRYRNVIDRGGGDNLKEFISAGVNAYALGCTDEGLRKELMIMKNSGVEIEGMQYSGGKTSLKSKIIMEEVNECILWLSIIFITILCTPQPTIVRWSSVPPVSSKVMVQWKGFCAIIANAYYMRGMAWLPVKTLQLEQMAVIGTAEEPSVVASRMQLVFSTLEVVSPQWPKV